MRSICVITGTRAEYGLLRPLMELIRDGDEFELQVLVTGMHLSPEFGTTWKEIEKGGFQISAEVEMLLSADSATTVGQSTGLGVMGCTRELNRLAPDLLIVLGDRFETFAAVTSALFLKIPVAHIHGGELTEGAFDDALRHSITKMSHLHFTSTEVYRNRVIQLGEAPDRVWNVGAPGLDSIANLDRVSKSELETFLDFEFRETNALVTFHPETLSEQAPEAQFLELLSAFDRFPEIGLIFTYPNADSDGRKLIERLDQYVAKNSERACVVSSLGQLRYFSAIELVDVVVGNSSSGIIEVPFFGTPTVNIGKRQDGRLQGDTIFSCAAIADEIFATIKLALQCEIGDLVDSPYGNGGASESIYRQLIEADFESLSVTKTFYDLKIGDE